MEKIQVNKKTYKIASDWSELTLHHFNETRKLEAQQESMPFLDFANKYIQLLTGIPSEDIDSITPLEFQDLMVKIMKITKANVNEDTNIIFEKDGVTYVFDDNISKMSFGQFIDLDYVTKDKDFWDIAHKVAAIFVRPISNGDSFILKGKKALRKKLTKDDFKISKYTYDGLEDRAEMFYNEMPMTYIYTIACFFLRLGENYQKIIQDSSQNKTMSLTEH